MAERAVPGGVSKIADFDSTCALWRYRCPVADIEQLPVLGSKYSPEFVVGGVPWRIHLQQRTETESQRVYLAVHLQCLTQNPAGTYGHFKLTVCNEQPEGAKSKNFHCHFKKSGSAWGLHHFILLDRLLQPDAGFIYFGTSSDGAFQDFSSPGRTSGARRATAGGAGMAPPCIVIDALIRVVEPDADGTYNLGTLPKVDQLQQQQQPLSRVPPGAGGGSRQAPPPGYGGYPPATWQQQQPPAVHAPSPSQRPPPPPPKASLRYPFDDSLCDMTFDVNGKVYKAHRCVVHCRLPRLVPPQPLPKGAVIPISAPIDVFERFLQFVYTEDLPESGLLRPEALLDLYALAMTHEFFSLAECCLRYCITSLTPQNILPIVLSRFNPADEALANLYLRVLVNGYDTLIEDKDFEKLPGALTRRLALVYARKEQLQSITVPKTVKTLASQLESLAESGAYADYDITLADGSKLSAHRFVLASRSQVMSHCFANAGAAPNFATQDLAFSRRAWDKYLVALYRGSTEAHKDLSAEDVAIVWKMNDFLRCDGQLRAETNAWINTDTALRLLVYAEKHSVPTLRDTAIDFLGVTFNERARRDPQIWDLVDELPQAAVVNLFRTVVERASP